MFPVSLRVCGVSLLLALSLHSQSVISTVAGTDFVFPAGIPNPLNAPFGAVYGLAIDDGGSLYVGDCDNNQIFRIAPSGAVSIVAGNGLRGGGGDGPALAMRTPCPSQLTFDRNGELLFTTNYSAIRRLTRDGRIVTVAGGIPFAGTPTPDGIPASQTIFLNNGGRDGGLAVDAAGNIYFTDVQSNRVRRIGLDGIVRTVAGNGTQGFSGDNGPGTRAQLNTPTGLAVAPDGTLFIADSGNNRIRAVSPDGTIRTIAGNGGANTAGDGGPATQASIGRPQSILLEPGGSLLVVQAFAAAVRRISPTGNISTVVAANAGLNLPSSPVRDSNGNTYLSDSGNARIRKIDAAGRLTLFAGNGNYRRSPDRAPALTSWLDRPVDVAISPSGLVTFSDTFENGSIRQIDASGLLVRLAGPLNRPSQIAYDAQGNLYVALRFGCAIGKLTPSGQYSIVAGTGVSGFSGDGGPATRATLCPAGVAVNAAGEIFIADSQNNRIRKVSTDGTIRTIAGTGGPGLRDISVPALEAALGNPTFILLDPAGNLFFSDTGSNSVRRLSPDGIITVIAGGREPGFSGDGGPAIQAQLNNPQGLARDILGNIYVADTGNQRVRLIRTTQGNSIITVAGGGRPGILGDGGAPEAAALLRPSGVALDASGRLYIADSFNDRIRVITNVATTFTVSSSSLTVSSLPTPLNVTSPIVGLAYSASASVPWLTVTPASGSLPASLQVSANTANLAPGTYTGAVNVTVPFASPSTRQVAVSVTVSPAPPPRLLVGLQNVALEMLVGTEGPSGVVPLSNQGGGIVSYNVSSSAPWLSVSPASGQIPASGAVSVSLKVDPGILSVGTYSSTITVSDGATAYRVPVTLSISATRARIVVSQPGLSFTAVQGGGAPASQSLGIFNDGAGSLAYEAKATTLSGGSWLTLSNASGRVERPLDDVGFIGVQPTARNLSPGDYYAEIRVTSPNAATPQLVTVVLKVLPAGSNPGPEIRPSALVFVGTPSSPPATQDIRISNLLDKSLSFVSASSTVDGAAWLSHLPSAASIIPDEPSRVVVQADFSGGAPGIRRGAVTLAFDDGSIRTLPVLTIVTSASTLPNNKNADRTAASCASPSLRNEFLSIPEGAVVTPGQPVAIEVKVVDDCGNLLTGLERNANSAVYAKFSNSDADLRLVPTGNGVWSGTWRPANPATGVVTVSAVSVFVQGLFLQAGRTDRGIRIGTGAGVPIVLPGALVHSASQRGDAPVAPGTLVTIYGSDLAPAPKATGVPLPTEVDGTQVLLAGQPLPILYSSQTQINAQIPYGLPVNTSHQVVVRRSATLSVPESFTVAATQPGIFTLNQQGTGQGIVMGPDQVSLARSESPAERGKAIVIYCAGLGAVFPDVAVGVPAPNSPLAQSVNPVAVTIGGLDAPVFFAGLTPGFTGLYQVNALVPSGAPTGDAVELVITTAGQTSNTVTLAIR